MNFKNIFTKDIINVEKMGKTTEKINFLLLEG